ncbi:serine hydrolase domain-containing protein [Aquibaculum arenosum]|uniref:Serine hydrolase n=1 Tax=Aquibaculum arenosum TaxID=3032591 RepID=A0ABT5YLB8_9PROT|nr:serine hydrolase [Fodinicurvata sp. CAU 1616]MDF2095692.1 serine hydrolase [Fodinicurvata sp. CAU 1616]
MKDSFRDVLGVSRMITRRLFNGFLVAGLAPPITMPARSQTGAGVEEAIAPLDQLYSIQIQRGNEVLLAQAPRGPGLDRVANIKSCSKSIVALILGTCIARNEIPSVDARLVDVAPDLVPQDATDGVSEITMEHLVSLTAGLEATSGGNYGGWIASANWVSDVLTRPIVAEPGSRMIYSTGSTHVLGAALTQASGETLLDLARDRLGRPMGFEIPPWSRDPQGFYLGGNEMALTPRAMLAIALMMRDGGRYDGDQIVPTDWIEASVVPRARSPYSGMDYEYGWFITETGYILARGFGGQVIAAHPDADLAVAITSDPTRPANSEGYFGDLVSLLDGPVLDLARQG